MKTELTTKCFNDYRPELIDRLRAFLLLEEDKYKKYLNVLEKQGEDIQKEDSTALVFHQDLGESLLTKIAVLERTILPLERELIKNDGRLPHDLAALRTETEELRIKAVSIGQENLKSMDCILKSLCLRIPKVRFTRNSGFSTSPAPSSRYVNISV